MAVTQSALRPVVGIADTAFFLLANSGIQSYVLGALNSEILVFEI